MYCPHTSVDAAKGGNGDWLADVVTGHFVLDSAIDAESKIGGFETNASLPQRYGIHEYAAPTGSHKTDGYVVIHSSQSSIMSF